MPSLVAAAAGDVEAVGRLYDALVGPIYRYVAVRVRRREDAEDLTQLVFERIVAALPRYRHNGSAVRGVGLPHRAQRGDRPPAPDCGRPSRWTVIAEPPEAAASTLLSLRGEEIRELRAAIRPPDPGPAEALALRYAGGLSADEAARVMGRQAGTIRGLTFRAIEALRRQLGGATER